MQAVLKSMQVLLLNMSNTLELSGLFFALGNFLSFSVPRGLEKITGLWFAREISTQLALWYMYIGFPTGKNGGGSSHQLKICSFAPPGKISLVDPHLPPNFYAPPHQRLILPSSPANNNFHVKTQ